jgi:DNA sulfur modification protein DndD
MSMRFKKLSIRNFGPYYGNHTIKFAENAPIILIHGDNMSGKTSFFNSIKWVLYGHASNRLKQPYSKLSLINQDAKDEGDYFMSITLDFEVSGVNYELQRTIEAKKGYLFPSSDADLQHSVYLKKEHKHINMGEVQPEINRILHEQISRFFLFDGELLNDYEALLVIPERQAQLIKESIENILGVPTLTNSINDLRINLKDTTIRQRNLAARDHEAQVFAAEGARLDTEIEACESDLISLKEQHKALANKQSELELFFENIAGIEADIQRLQELTSNRESLKEEQISLAKSNKDKLGSAWRDLLQPTINKQLAIIEPERERLISNLSNITAVRKQIKELKGAAINHRCPTCGNNMIDVSEISRKIIVLENEIQGLNYDQDSFNRLSDSIAQLKKISPSNVIDTIKANEIRLISIRSKLGELDAKIKRLEDHLKDHPRSDISSKRYELTEIIKDLGAIEKTIDDKQTKKAKLQDDAARNRSLISRNSGPEMRRVNREVQIYEEVIRLYEQTLVQLREDLRKSVEREATRIFKELTTDKSYLGLRINDIYGLDILDSNNIPVDIRSAGAEQVVALSLIGALNQNAVRRGPIVMDTPFGRLDPGHRENILKFLPTMAEQITLLVHGGEIDKERDLSHIRSQIDAEYEIIHPTSRRSEIRKLS